MAVTGTATTNQQTVTYFVIPQQNPDLMALISEMFPAVGDNAAVPGDVIVMNHATQSVIVVKAADWPTYATPTQ